MDAGEVGEVIEHMAAADHGVGSGERVVGQDEQAQLLHPRSSRARQLQHRRRGVGGDHAMAGGDQLLGQQAAATADLEDQTVASPDRLEALEDAGRTGCGVEVETEVVDESEVSPVVRGQ